MTAPQLGRLPQQLVSSKDLDDQCNANLQARVQEQTRLHQRARLQQQALLTTVALRSELSRCSWPLGWDATMHSDLEDLRVRIGGYIRLSKTCNGICSN